MNNEKSYKCITLTRMNDINKYIPHKEKYERRCVCCNESAYIRIRFCRKDENDNRQYRSLYLCEDHLKDLKFFLNYF